MRVSAPRQSPCTAARAETDEACLQRAADLFGVGVPVATITPATGVRLRTAAAMALASRHPMRVGRLLLQALRFPMVLRGLRRSAAPREYLQDQSAQPLAPASGA